jgi:hypothetical protein
VTVCVSEVVEGTVVVVVDGGISVAVRSASVVERRVETFTFRFEVSSSLFRLITTKKTIRSSAPITPSGIKIQLGTPSSRRGTAVTMGVLSITGAAEIGRPQLGHATAEFDVSCPHSGQ